jgi:hypothetical protein
VTKLRYVEFKTLQSFPGYSSVTNLVEYDPEESQRARAFDLDMDLKTRLIRISVPWERVRTKGIGRWHHKEGGKPNFGLGRVCYVPLEDVAKFEVSKDAEELDPELDEVRTPPPG